MTHVIYILIISFILALYVHSIIAAKRKRELDEIIYDGLHADYYALTQEYKALDQGMTEVQDAYATDSLQYEETISGLTAKVEAYREVGVEKEIEIRNRDATIANMEAAMEMITAEPLGFVLKEPKPGFVGPGFTSIPEDG